MVKIGKVEKYMLEKIEKEGAFLNCLIDPANQDAESGAKMAKDAADAGADIIVLGGSVGAQGKPLEATAKRIKEETDLPVLIFPGNIATITEYADAIYFMSLFNSSNIYWLSTAQMTVAPVVRKIKIEPIPTCYLVAEPGQAVGWVGEARLLPRNKPYLWQACSLAGKYLGARVVLIDAGSGAPEPNPVENVKAVKAAIEETIFVSAGGVKTPEQAFAIAKAGADGVQIGTAFESKPDRVGHIRKFVTAIKRAGKEKV